MFQLSVMLGWRLFRNANDRRSEEVLQRYEEAGIKATNEANSETEGLNSRILILVNLY